MESWNHFLSSPPCPGGSSAQFKLVRKHHPQDGSFRKYVKNKTDRFALNCSVSASLRSRWASRLRGTRVPWDPERRGLCTGTRQACPWGPWLWPLLSRRAPESNAGTSGATGESHTPVLWHVWPQSTACGKSHRAKFKVSCHDS